eukprot:Cvel_23165.t1-p1 / transcript=Cvel_23165.t1 / gene=Cvel_23165 / organism=Chromera_velia_CCMP2878 / gene_product=hypothetical protein / transcript_product=hypothetical protein / location=Cvel_scaffold2357:21484-28557(+) / protein_length=1560 / sequence_SO=supercontig / SO=protein_coding / is_pseudo=false
MSGELGKGHLILGSRSPRVSPTQPDRVPTEAPWKDAHRRTSSLQLDTQEPDRKPHTPSTARIKPKTKVNAKRIGISRQPQQGLSLSPTAALLHNEQEDFVLQCKKNSFVAAGLNVQGATLKFKIEDVPASPTAPVHVNENNQQTPSESVDTDSNPQAPPPVLLGHTETCLPVTFPPPRPAPPPPTAKAVPEPPPDSTVSSPPKAPQHAWTEEQKATPPPPVQQEKSSSSSEAEEKADNMTPPPNSGTESNPPNSNTEDPSGPALILHPKPKPINIQIETETDPPTKTKIKFALSEDTTSQDEVTPLHQDSQPDLPPSPGEASSKTPSQEDTTRRSQFTITVSEIVLEGLDEEEEGDEKAYRNPETQTNPKETKKDQSDPGGIHESREEKPDENNEALQASPPSPLPPDDQIPVSIVPPSSQPDVSEVNTPPARVLAEEEAEQGRDNTSEKEEAEEGQRTHEEDNDSDSPLPSGSPLSSLSSSPTQIHNSATPMQTPPQTHAQTETPPITNGTNEESEPPPPVPPSQDQPQSQSSQPNNKSDHQEDNPDPNGTSDALPQGTAVISADPDSILQSNQQQELQQLHSIPAHAHAIDPSTPSASPDETRTNQNSSAPVPPRSQKSSEDQQTEQQKDHSAASSLPPKDNLQETPPTPTPQDGAETSEPSQPSSLLSAPPAPSASSPVQTLEEKKTEEETGNREQNIQKEETEMKSPENGESNAETQVESSSPPLQSPADAEQAHPLLPSAPSEERARQMENQAGHAGAPSPSPHTPAPVPSSSFVTVIEVNPDTPQAGHVEATQPEGETEREGEDPASSPHPQPSPSVASTVIHTGATSEPLPPTQEEEGEPQKENLNSTGNTQVQAIAELPSEAAEDKDDMGGIEIFLPVQGDGQTETAQQDHPRERELGTGTSGMRLEDFTSVASSTFGARSAGLRTTRAAQADEEEEKETDVDEEKETEDEEKRAVEPGPQRSEPGTKKAFGVSFGGVFAPPPRSAVKKEEAADSVPVPPPPSSSAAAAAVHPDAVGAAGETRESGVDWGNRSGEGEMFIDMKGDADKVEEAGQDLEEPKKEEEVRGAGEEGEEQDDMGIDVDFGSDFGETSKKFETPKTTVRETRGVELLAVAQDARRAAERMQKDALAAFDLEIDDSEGTAAEGKSDWGGKMGESGRPTGRSKSSERSKEGPMASESKRRNSNASQTISIPIEFSEGGGEEANGSRRHSTASPLPAAEKGGEEQGGRWTTQRGEAEGPEELRESKTGSDGPRTGSQAESVSGSSGEPSAPRGRPLLLYSQVESNLTALRVEPEKEAQAAAAYEKERPFWEQCLSCLKCVPCQKGKQKQTPAKVVVPQLSSSLNKQKTLTVCWAWTPLSAEAPMHRHMFRILLYALTGKNEELDFSMSEWRTLGVDDTHPLKSFGSVQLLSLLHLCFFCRSDSAHVRRVARWVFLQSLPEQTGCPFVPVCGALSSKVFYLFRTGRISNEVNNQKSVFRALNEFFGGAVIRFFDLRRISQQQQPQGQPQQQQQQQQQGWSSGNSQNVQIDAEVEAVVAEISKDPQKFAGDMR